MKLSFATQINGQETHFMDKILGGLADQKLITDKSYNYFVKKCINSRPLNDFIFTADQKIHTIRKDANNRWKSGNRIDFVSNNRASKLFHFAPVVECKSVQFIQIKNNDIIGKRVFVDNPEYDNLFLKELKPEEIEILSKNDGFDSVDDFWNFFANSTFTGKIIHWTDKKY